MNHIQKHILTKNKSNLVAKLAVNHIIPHLKNLLNKKIFKVDAAYTNLLENTYNKSNKFAYSEKNEDNTTLAIYCRIEPCYNDNLVIKINICVSGGSSEDNTYFNIYDEQYIEIGKLKNKQTLISLLDINNIIFPEDLIYENEISKITQFLELEENLKKIKTNINIPYEYYKYGI